MALAHHLIFAAYGFILPNNPDSTSRYVRSNSLWRSHGPAPRSRNRTPPPPQPNPETSLQHNPVHFSPAQIQSIAAGFHQASDESSYQILACSILADHTHLVIIDHPTPPRRIIAHLKTRATQRLQSDQLHPFRNLSTSPLPSPWSRSGWTTFLDTDDDITHAIAYVHDNLTREKLPPQPWPFLHPR